MATPEQNTMLGLQLFAPIAQQYNAQNDARTNLMLRIAQQEREEQNRLQQMMRNEQAQKSAFEREDKLRRDLATQGYDKAIDLETMRGVRDDKRISESERRQSADLDAREARGLQDEFEKRYQEYAFWAIKAKQKVKERKDYPTTAVGIGELNKDLAVAKDAAETATRKAAAIPIESNIQRLTQQSQELRAVADAARTASVEDRDRARSLAAQELNRRIETGQQYPGLPTNKTERDKALALLGDAKSEAEARTRIGAAAWTAFEALQQNFVASILAQPDRRAEAAQAEQAWRGAASNLDRFMQTAAAAGGQNEFVAEAFTKGMGAMQKLMTPTAPQKSTEERFKNNTPPPAGSTSPTIPTRGVGMVIPGMLENTTNEPIIAAENQRRQQSVLSAQQQPRADEYNSVFDRLQGLQSNAGAIRSGQPVAVSSVINPMGGYVPGQPVNQTAQAQALFQVLQQQEAARKELEAARRQMLWLQTPTEAR